MSTPNSNAETEQQRRAKSDRYFRLSQRFLKHAQEQLDLGDTLQASEKAYGAVSHAVKSYGELRGWNHSNHHRVGLILDQLSEEREDSDFVTHYLAVKALHDNYFEYELSTVRVQGGLVAASALMDRLETARSEHPKPLPASALSREQRRRLSQLMQPMVDSGVPVEDLPPLEDLPE